MAAKGNNGQIRLIAGQFRGRKLPVQDLTGLRPTTDRVRETLFNWLQGHLQGAQVLDCFAGAGALGFEALSRYAAALVLVEKEHRVAQQLTANLERLQAQAEVIQADALQWLQKAPARAMDVVFVDPPFGQQLAAPALALLEQQGWLADDAFIYVETEQGLTLTVPGNWRLHRQLNAGQVQARLYQRQESSS